MPGKPKDAKRAGRYMGDDVDEHAVEAGIMMMGPPCMVAVFKVPDEEALEETINKAQEELHKFRGRLRALNLNVEQLTNKTNTLIFLKVSAPEPMLKWEAEHNQLRLRLLEKWGGALCPYTQELEDKNAYDKPLDGNALFCSAQQLKVHFFLVLNALTSCTKYTKALTFQNLCQIITLVATSVPYGNQFSKVLKIVDF